MTDCANMYIHEEQSWLVMVPSGSSKEKQTVPYSSFSLKSPLGFVQLGAWVKIRCSHLGLAWISASNCWLVHRRDSSVCISAAEVFFWRQGTLGMVILDQARFFPNFALVRPWLSFSRMEIWAFSMVSSLESLENLSVMLSPLVQFAVKQRKR